MITKTQHTTHGDALLFIQPPDLTGDAGPQIFGPIQLLLLVLFGRGHI